MFPRPRNGNRFDAALAALTAWHSGTNLGLELHRIKVSPSSLRCSVVPGTPLVALGATDGITDEGKTNDNLVAGQIKIDVFNRPG